MRNTDAPSERPRLAEDYCASGLLTALEYSLAFVAAQARIPGDDARIRASYGAGLADAFFVVLSHLLTDSGEVDQLDFFLNGSHFDDFHFSSRSRLVTETPALFADCKHVCNPDPDLAR